jgi:Transposase and inactivated derivatives
MKKGYHKGQELTMSELGLSLEEFAGQPLELFAQEGARLLLTVAMEEEVTDFLKRRPFERSQGNLRGYRNGHRERQVSCGAGEVEVAVPRMSDTKEAFHSQLLEAWQRRSKLLEETIPLLYVEGLSTRDFKRALQPLWGKSGLSRSSVSRANKALKEAFNNWRRRDLSLEEIIYLFLDGIYLGVRGNSRDKEAVLVAHGINRDGKRVVLHLSLGGRESTESWKGVLNDLVERGLKPPQLCITDGNPGLLKALKDIWPEVPRQRCAVHRIRNVLARVPKKRQNEVKKALHRIFYAACLDDARDEAKQFLSRYSREFPTATETLAKHLEECLTFYRFPERHWKHIRTSNVIERAFKEVKRRTRVVGRFPNETSALVMVFSLLEEDRVKWQKVGMRAEDIVWIEEASKALKQEPIKLEFLEGALVA